MNSNQALSNYPATMYKSGLRRIVTLMTLPCMLASQLLASSYDLIKRSDVANLVSNDLIQWKANLPEQRPRLFLTAEEYNGLKTRYQKSEGQERKWFDTLIETADKLSTRQLRVYQTPEELVSPRLSLFAAEEELWMRLIGDDMITLSIAMLISDNPQYRTYLHDLVMSACRFPQWGVSLKNGDLSAGHLSRGISLVYDWHMDLFTEEERAEISEVMRERVGDLYAMFFKKSGWSNGYDRNHNHVAATGIGLAGLAFLNEIPEADDWSAGAYLNFEKVSQLNNSDGSTGEGVPYWSYSLFFIVQYIEALANVIPTKDLYDYDFYKNSATYRLHSSTPGFDGVLQYGDAVPRDYYGPHHFLYKLASQYGDSDAQYLANTLPFDPLGDSDAIALTALWYDPSIPTTAPTQLDYHSADLDTVTMRSGWTEDDYLLAIKSGYTNRNHSHLDAGAITWAFGSEWLIDTPGYGHGWGNRDFWQSHDKRWTFFSNATESHTTLLVNGKNQLHAPDARSTVVDYLSTATQSWTRIDMIDAYADVQSIERTVQHRRGDYALVWDTAVAPEVVTLEWLLKIPEYAKINDRSVTIEGTAASLDVLAIYPRESNFALRAPTTKHVDLPESRQTVAALAQEGNAMNFLVALVPTAAGQKAIQSLRRAEKDGMVLLNIDGENWNDYVLFSTTSLTQPISGLLSRDSFTATAPDLPSQEIPSESLRLVATAANVRFVNNRPDSALLCDASEVAIEDWQLTTAAPATFALQKGADNTWLLDVAERGMEIRQISQGYTIYSAHEKESISGSKLEMGQYIIQKQPQ